MRSHICLKCNRKVNLPKSKYGLHPTCFQKWFDAEKHIEFENIARKESISSGDPSIKIHEKWQSSFFHGRFLKYAAELAGKSYIIKLQEDHAPELPFVEYLCNQIADALGIKIPSFYCIIFHGKPAFVTLNLLGRHADIQSLLHIYHYVTSSDDYSCEGLMKIIQTETQNMRDIDNFIEICLFDGLIGNHDRHGRNLGLIVDANKKSLCPAYDNTSVLGLEQGEILRANFSPRGKIATKHSIEPTLKDYVNDFLRLGYKSSVQNFHKRIKIKKIEQLIKKSHCSQLMKNAFLKLIQSRYAEISDALQN